MLVRPIVTSVVVALLPAAACSAAVVYDAITGRTTNGTFIPDPTSEHAQELTLATSATTLTSVEMVMRNVSTAVAYQAQMTVRIYSSTGGLPAALLATRNLNANVPANTTQTLVFPFDGTAVGTSTIWVSFVIPANTLGGPSIFGIRETALPPALSVGSNRAWNTRRPIGNPNWLETQPPIAGGSAWSVRINDVPAPSAAGLLALAGLACARRRRA